MRPQKQLEQLTLQLLTEIEILSVCHTALFTRVAFKCVFEVERRICANWESAINLTCHLRSILPASHCKTRLEWANSSLAVRSIVSNDLLCVQPDKCMINSFSVWKLLCLCGFERKGAFENEWADFRRDKESWGQQVKPLNPWWSGVSLETFQKAKNQK